MSQVKACQSSNCLGCSYCNPNFWDDCKGAACKPACFQCSSAPLAPLARQCETADCNGCSFCNPNFWEDNCQLPEKVCEPRCYYCAHYNPDEPSYIPSLPSYAPVAFPLVAASSASSSSSSVPPPPASPVEHPADCSGCWRCDEYPPASPSYSPTSPLRAPLPIFPEEIPSVLDMDMDMDMDVDDGPSYIPTSPTYEPSSPKYDPEDAPGSPSYDPLSNYDAPEDCPLPEESSFADRRHKWSLPPAARVRPRRSARPRKIVNYKI